MNAIEQVEAKYLNKKKDIAPFRVGDTVRVEMKAVEKDRERTQSFEGLVIRRRGRGMRETFTLRRISYGEGVEKIVPINSPFLQKVEVVREGSVRRSRLYYMRKRAGKEARVEEPEHEEATPEPARPSARE